MLNRNPASEHSWTEGSKQFRRCRITARYTLRTLVCDVVHWSETAPQWFWLREESGRIGREIKEIHHRDAVDSRSYLSIPQIWGVLRLRGIQKALADTTNNAYVDNQWTFGQVVAVMLFAPVATEIGYSLMKSNTWKPCSVAWWNEDKKIPQYIIVRWTLASSTALPVPSRYVMSKNLWHNPITLCKPGRCNRSSKQPTGINHATSRPPMSLRLVFEHPPRIPKL